MRRFDINRVIPPFAYRLAGGNGAGSFDQWNQSKRGVRLNLEMPEGVAIAKSRAAHCDLVVDNFAPGVIARIELGYEVLREIRPGSPCCIAPSARAWHVPTGLEKHHEPGVARATAEHYGDVPA